MSTTFADIVPVHPLSSHSYSIDLRAEWDIENVLSGGYVASCFLLVARTHLATTHASRSEPHPINLQLVFPRRTSASPAAFKVRDVKLGSRISNLHIILSQQQQDGKRRDMVEGYVTLSSFGFEAGLSLSTEYKLHPQPLPADLPTLLADGEDRNFAMRQVPEYLHAAQNIRIHLEKPDRRSADRPRSILDQWVRFFPQNKPGKWTNDCLGFAVDMFLQIVESYINLERGDSDLQDAPLDSTNPRPKYWYPTLSLTLDVKKLLPPGGVEWLFVRVESKIIKNGRSDLEITILDAEGEIVALSTHSALVMSDGNKKPSLSKMKSKF